MAFDLRPCDAGEVNDPVPAPAADLGVTLQLASTLISDQRPDLADLPLRPFAHGWDNETFALGDHLLLRIPRRAASVDLLINEQRWLPTLADALPVAVPEPLFVGARSDQFNHPWSIVPRLDGAVLGGLPIGRRAAAADGLADFLVALHRPAPSDAPANPFRGVPLVARHAAMIERIEGLPDAADRNPAGAGLRDRVRRRWLEWSATTAYCGPPVWLHGDPHPLNLLVGSDHRLTGVLDWGDLTAGDPASDLAAGWLAFAAADRQRFGTRYGDKRDCDPTLWIRAKAWALNLATAFLVSDDPQLVPIARHALVQLLAED